MPSPPPFMDRMIVSGHTGLSTTVCVYACLTAGGEEMWIYSPHAASTDRKQLVCVTVCLVLVCITSLSIGKVLLRGCTLGYRRYII